MTTYYDVFNGDADGICALHQLRLVQPRAAELVTGVKRDIALLQRITPQSGDEVTVLDISLARNADALQRLLTSGARCEYFDHHFPGEIPAHANFIAHIDTATDVCTSLLVNRHLNDAHKAWAVVAAFGDGMDAAARSTAASLDLADNKLAQLQALGEAINYNAYGDSVEDLNYPPADLYRAISDYPDPFDFLSGEPIVEVLSEARADDLYRASEIQPEVETAAGAIYILPDAAWSRRVSGTFGNDVAHSNPARAHAVMTRADNGYRISVRAARDHSYGADALARQFGGGGREGAAGIDLLPATDFDRFVKAFSTHFAH